MFLNRSRQVPAEDTPAFGGVAERFRRAGDLDRAIALCREGLKKFPTLLSARVTLGWALLDKGQYDEARVELEQVLRRAPDNLAAIRGLAELHDRAENQVPSMEHGSEWHQSTASELAEDAAAVSDMLSRLGEAAEADGLSDDLAAPAPTISAPSAAPVARDMPPAAPGPSLTGGMITPVPSTEPASSTTPVQSAMTAGLAHSAMPAGLAKPATAEPAEPAMSSGPAESPLAVAESPAPPEFIFTNSAGVSMPTASLEFAAEPVPVEEPGRAVSVWDTTPAADPATPAGLTTAAEFEAFEVGPPAVYEFTNSAGAPFVPAGSTEDARATASEMPVVLDVGELPPAAFEPAEMVAPALVGDAGHPDADVDADADPDAGAGAGADADWGTTAAAAVVPAADVWPAPAAEPDADLEILAPASLTELTGVPFAPSAAALENVDEIDPELPPSAGALIESGEAVSLQGMPAEQPVLGAIEDDVVALPSDGELELEELASVFANEPQAADFQPVSLEPAQPTPRRDLDPAAKPAASEDLQSDGLLELLSPEAIPSVPEPPPTLSALSAPFASLVDVVAADRGPDPLGMAVPQVVPITHVSRRAAQIAALERFLRQVQNRRLQLSAGSVA